jgi:mono/diheme cytochrome c family protein
MKTYPFRIRSRLSLRERSIIQAFVSTPKRSFTATLLGALAGLAMLFAAPSADAGDAKEAKKIFTQRCSACHTFGKGVKVGPDLKGVTERRERPWLLKFVRSSQRVIASGDPVATALFQEFRRQQMPDWSDLSEEQVSSILDWFATNGPEQKEADERNADSATPAEVAAGRRLFHGSEGAHQSNGGMACGACHAVVDDGSSVGGSFGPELTATYTSYQDRALTLFLKRPCILRLPESTATTFLTPEESFAIKAYLRQVAIPKKDVVSKTDAKPVGGTQ